MVPLTEAPTLIGRGMLATISCIRVIIMSLSTTSEQMVLTVVKPSTEYMLASGDSFSFILG